MSTPYGHPIHAGHRQPDPHYAAQEAETGAANVAWVDGSPAYRATITADLRREDIARYTQRLNGALSVGNLSDAYNYEMWIAAAQRDLAAAEAVIAAEELRTYRNRPVFA